MKKMFLLVVLCVLFAPPALAEGQMESFALFFKEDNRLEITHFLQAPPHDYECHELLFGTQVVLRDGDGWPKWIKWYGDLDVPVWNPVMDQQQGMEEGPDGRCVLTIPGFVGEESQVASFDDLHLIHVRSAIAPYFHWVLAKIVPEFVEFVPPKKPKHPGGGSDDDSGNGVYTGGGSRARTCMVSGVTGFRSSRFSVSTGSFVTVSASGEVTGARIAQGTGCNPSGGSGSSSHTITQSGDYSFYMTHDCITAYVPDPATGELKPVTSCNALLCLTVTCK